MKRTHRKRRSFWIDMTFSIAIITLTVAAIYLITLASKNETAASGGKNSGATPSPITIDTTDSNYPGIKIITEISNDSFAPFAIQYPQSTHSHFNEEISAYIKKAKQDYLAKMNESKQRNGELSGELNISFETLLHHSDHYSFVLINSSFIGDDTGATEIRSFHISPETGEVITIEDIFNHDLNNLKQITTLVKESLENDPTLDGLLALKEIQRYTEPVWENYKNFAITDDSLIFYFDENTIADEAAGPPIVSISLQESNDWLAAEFKLQDTSIDKTEIEDDAEKVDGEKSSDTSQNTNDTSMDHEKEGSETATGAEPVKNEAIDETPDVADVPDTSVKQVALTFDDGPDPKVTMQILDILKKYDAKATFFMLGSRVEYYPEIAKNVADAGHELGNHTWNHPDLTKSGVEKIRNEINRTSKIIHEVTGMESISLRPPYGAVNKTVREQTDLPIVLWDVDTLDWKHRDANQLLLHVKDAVKDGSIILMHDIHQATADGLDAVLAYLQSEGYTFVTVSELN